jgi:hypothetical protein
MGYFGIKRLGFIHVLKRRYCDWDRCGLIEIQLHEKYKENFDVSSEDPFPTKVYYLHRPLDIL